ncbi:hypothetical protein BOSOLAPHORUS_88 [Erwinia phage vB_EamM_Bosolaphorus]|uniref:Uncharacterized protein n=1 Tax=Erwinia phage vB_EamM_Bosolaphorus TaxID=2060126 RepID=A0A2H5BHW0_9CAUD|nr:hypothetical protein BOSOLAPHORUS_88 [Erwinia phage vB_EamM_Bosolaphorus]
MSKGTLKGLGMVLACLVIGVLLFVFATAVQAADTPINPHCVAITNDSTITTQCDDGTVVITNTATSTVMVCHVSKETKGLPQCVKDRVVISN